MSDVESEDMLGSGFDPSQIRISWEHFFQKYGYFNVITEMSSHYPEVRSLNVSYEDLDEFSSDFSLYIVQNAEETIESGINVIRDYISTPTISLGGKTKNSVIVNIRIVDLPENIKIDIRNLRSINVGRLLSITGIVRKTAEVVPRLYNAAFMCSFCGHVSFVLQQKGRLEMPDRCENPDCGAVEKNKPRFTLRLDESKFIDTQKIEIQEEPENINGGAQPLRLSAIIEDDIAGKIFPGDRVTLDGIIKAEQKMLAGNLLTEFTTHLYVLNIRKATKEVDEVVISPEEEREILDMAKDPKILENLAASIAPTIYGLENIKKTLALQMFGGVRKTMKDGTTIRGDIHIMMVGDPGTAKSQLLRYMSEISPRGILAIGKGSSAAGLTAAAVRDEFGEGRWTLEAGALVLADNGFVAIDELDKMDVKDTAAMHEAMEQQTVTVSKAGIIATLKSRCSVLAAANPEKGRYDETAELMEQVKFPAPLISRFDVIFKMVDRPDEKRDSELASHVLNAHRLGEIYRSYELRNEEEPVLTEEERVYEPPFSKEMLRKYVAYSKNHVIPKLTPDAIEYLREEYVRTRNPPGRRMEGRSPVPITARQLESTIRLAEASARARLSTAVSLEDAIVAKTIVDSFLKELSSDKNGYDIDILETGISTARRTSIDEILYIIKDLKAMKKGAAPFEKDVIDEAITRGMKKEDAEKTIRMAISSTILYRPMDKCIDEV